MIPQNLAADKTQFADIVQIVRNPPSYPDLSLENAEEGTAIVCIAVGSMDNARFKPARYRNKPVWRAVSPQTVFELN
ncbi:Uncharacterised protein [Kingella potus]|uniref:Uncharacterized protein n=1 Tax=Kingella potus TaxID=265175 RepID=A0A377QYX5_9NEIS|nr:hypothetical protein [Kingella potus]STR00433.1 Uncharacterised protein [Kingella potus]